MAVNTIDKLQFLLRDSYTKRGTCRRHVSVCLCVCVCVSVTIQVKIRQFRRKTRYNSKTVHDRPIVSIKVE